MKKFTIILLFLSILPSISIAAGSTGAVTVFRIDAQKSGNFVVTLNENQVNPDGCNNSRVLTVHSSNANKDAIYSNLLAALINEKTVLGWVSGCTGSFSTLNNLTIQN